MSQILALLSKLSNQDLVLRQPGNCVPSRVPKAKGGRSLTCLVAIEKLWRFRFPCSDEDFLCPQFEKRIGVQLKLWSLTKVINLIQTKPFSPFISSEDNFKWSLMFGTPNLCRTVKTELDYFSRQMMSSMFWVGLTIVIDTDNFEFPMVQWVDVVKKQFYLKYKNTYYFILFYSF